MKPTSQSQQQKGSTMDHEMEFESTVANLALERNRTVLEEELVPRDYGPMMFGASLALTYCRDAGLISEDQEDVFLAALDNYLEDCLYG